MAKQGFNPRFNASREIPSFEEVARQVHIDRMPTWKNAKHGAQWINTLRDYAFPKIGRMPIGNIPPAEAEQNFYAQRGMLDMVA
ncbi:phage integrase central domain-containing protein [Pararhodobacter sp.]|uniref:phage integrase central domain-containing protein n=1 Tax=Pararhodobacter sp. TaxID=2127056 RepID=UPI003A5988D8